MLLAHMASSRYHMALCLTHQQLSMSCTMQWEHYIEHKQCDTVALSIMSSMFHADKIKSMRYVWLIPQLDQ
jgi:hypothetical protein